MINEEIIYSTQEEIIYSTKEELIEHANKLIGRKFSDIDITGRISSNKGKGKLGQIIEESHFGYKVNSRSEADFKDLNIELKVTPYKENKNGTYSAKERLVLNIIDYLSEVNKDFYTSSYWLKNSKLLLVFYKYEEGKAVSDYVITNTLLFQIPEGDLPTVQQDWMYIVEKIRQGKAHEISEGDTFYLGACSKGKDSNSLRQQPFSDIPAMQRAFSLKQSYMTYVLRTYVLGQTGTKLIKEEKNTIEKYIEKTLKPILGFSFIKLCEKYGQVNKSKNSVQILMSNIFGIKGTDLSKVEEFQKANIKIKTIIVSHDNKIKESMSFPTFKFKEIINIDWEESELKKILTEQKYLFLVFKNDKAEGSIFIGYKFWNMPYDDIFHVQKVYENTVDIINNGVKIVEQKVKNGVRKLNNLPSKKENPVCHVRPHAADSNDVYELPDGRYMTKQCFWLNNTYVYEQIKGLIK